MTKRNEKLLCLHNGKPQLYLYTGITNNVLRRAHQHKNHLCKGFTDKYNVNRLVYFETFSDPISAITREKQIKKWNRSKKIDLIESMNPDWKDLSEVQ